MNTNFERDINYNPNRIPTTDEYFKIIDNPNRTVEEDVLADRYDKFINACNKYPDYISDTAQGIVNNTNSNIIGFATKGTLTQRERQVLNRFNNSFNNNQNNVVDFQNYTRKRSIGRKAGYINAAVLLTMILNIGFILAMTFISK